MRPFTYAEHGVFPEGGYVHEAGINRQQRRQAWRSLSSRKSRMTLRRYHQRKVLDRLEAKRQEREAVKGIQFLKLMQFRMDRDAGLR